MSDDEYDFEDNEPVEDDEENSVTGVIDLAQTNDIPAEFENDEVDDIEVNEEPTFEDDKSDDGAVDEFDEQDFDNIDKVVTENTLRKTTIIVDPNQRKTSNIMTAFEFTEAKAIRASQIERRQNVLTNVDGLDDAEKMAEKELYDGKCPLVLRRKVGEKHENDQLYEYVEFWDVNIMTKPVMRD